jgi:hypothetical protein
VVRVTWGHPPTTRLVGPLQGRGRRGGFDIGHEDFKTRRVASIRVERAHAPHSPGSGEPTPRRLAARSALPTRRDAFTTRARCQVATPVGWLLVRWIHPSPQPAPTDATARTCGCLSRRCCENEAVPRADRLADTWLRQMRNGYGAAAGRSHGRNPPCGPGVCQGFENHCPRS